MIFYVAPKKSYEITPTIIPYSTIIRDRRVGGLGKHLWFISNIFFWNKMIYILSNIHFHQDLFWQENLVY